MYCMSFCIYFTFIPPLTHIYAIYIICIHWFLGVQTLHIKTFVFAFLSICACISRHLCLHFLTYVTSYVFAFTLTRSTFVVTYMVQARQMCFYWTVFCRNTYTLPHNKCKRMHSDMHRYMPPYATTNA